jgi:CheY-like chemotaxis protein
MASPTPPRIAIINSNEDLLEILRTAFEEEGYFVATAHIRAFRLHEADLDAFIEQAQPQVVIWDLAPPYDMNWRYFQEIRQFPVMQGRRFLLTSTNAERAREIAWTDEDIVEVVGKPFDLEGLEELVARAIQQPS